MTTLAQQILECSVKELHQLKEAHRGMLAEAVIDQEIRLRRQLDSLNVLTRERTERIEGGGG